MQRRRHPAAAILAAALALIAANGGDGRAASGNPTECDLARALLGAAGPDCPPPLPPTPVPAARGPALPPMTAPPPQATLTVPRPLPPPSAAAPAAPPAAVPVTAPPAPAPEPPPTRPAAMPPLVVSVSIAFDFGSAHIRPESLPVLDRLAAVMTSPAAAGVRFRIVGHTDSIGSDAANLDLSLRRARAVAEDLTARHGVAADRLDTEGAGESRPLDPARPEAPENRRVEIRNLGR